MSMDGLSLYASMLEIKRVLTGGKIDKIQQTDQEELILTIRAGGENHKLLLNSSAADNRVHLTGEKRPSPAEAPMFCMLLRKRIAGGKILDVAQPKLDRVLTITIETYNELGDLAPFTLNCELMGKYSNIILVNEQGVIVDAIKRVGPGMSSVRLILPGLSYALPPAQDKQDPTLASPQAFALALSGEGSIGKALSGAFFGLSPNMGGMLASRYTGQENCAGLSPQERVALGEALAGFYRELSAGGVKPSAVVNGLGEPAALYPFPLLEEGTRGFDSMAQAMDAFYANREKQNWVQRHGASARKVLQNNMERCEKKMALYADALNTGEAMEKTRLYGELLTANLHRLKIGEEKAVVENYYCDPPEAMAVPLDKQLTPGENAQRYYKKYQKLKAARDMAIVQREQTQAELAYLEGQMDNLGKCTGEAELGELIEELREQGYMRRERGAKKGMRRAASKPMCFLSSDGIKIYVGKNNKQNDELTLRFADASDIWLHTKNIPGSHVIIKSGGEPPLTTLNQAALLAAYYSKARGGANVPVDYTAKKYVKKPAGAKPGMVIYTTNRTAFVTPEETLVKGIHPVE